MSDEHDRRLDALLAMTRNEAPDTGALEEHFETRLMARLAEHRENVPSPWQLLVWRMVPAFAALAVILLICSIAVNPVLSSDPFAAITNGYEDQAARNYLLGESR